MLLTTLISYVVMRPLIPVNNSFLVIDTVITGSLLVGILLLLKNVVKYSNLSSLYSYQKVAVYASLAVLFVICWYGIGLFILYLLFPFGEWLLLLRTAPLRIVLGLLVYGSAIQWYSSRYESELDYSDTNYNPDTKDNSTELALPEEADPIESIIDRIAIKNGQKIDVVPVSEIIYLQAEGDYVMIHSSKGKFLKEQTMKSFESLLPSNQFVRVHRSSIVNVDFISQIELYDKQNQLLKMQNGVLIRVSINGYRALKKTLQLK